MKNSEIRHAVEFDADERSDSIVRHSSFVIGNFFGLSGMGSQNIDL
jgi:hypothetical protein